MAPRHSRQSSTVQKIPKQNREQSISVREKIFRAQRDNAIFRHKKGPTIELFFHELKHKEPRSTVFFDYIFASLCGILLVCLYPFIALGIKISSTGPIIQKTTTAGKAGDPFKKYEFRTHAKISLASKTTHSGFGSLLQKTGLCKLPMVINIFRGQMHAVGPAAYSLKESTYWNTKFDEFYKRYAVKPGFFAVAPLRKENESDQAIEQQLRKDLKYVVSPTLKNNMKVFFGNFWLL